MEERLFVHQVLREFMEERLCIHMVAGRRRKDLGVPGPAQAFVSLWTVRGDIDEVGL